MLFQSPQGLTAPEFPGKAAQVLISQISPRRNRWLRDPIEQEDRGSAGLEVSGSDLFFSTVLVEKSFDE